MSPPSISLGMFVSLVIYVALIMFFNFSIFQSQPLCSSYSGVTKHRNGMERNGIYRNGPEYTGTRQNDAGMDKNGTGTSLNDTEIYLK